MQKTATSPGSNFNRQGGSVFNQRQHECVFKIDARTPLRFCLSDWFRLYVESLLAVAPEVTKKACPCHPGLAALDFPHPIIAPGPAATDHPWPNAALTASCRSTHCATIALGLLKRGVYPGAYSFASRSQALAFDLKNPSKAKKLPAGSVQIPPSGGRVQAVRRGAFGRMPNEACWAKDGPSCRPSQRRRNEGS